MPIVPVVSILCLKIERYFCISMKAFEILTLKDAPTSPES